MTIEQIIAAKAAMTTLSATVGLWFCVPILILALAASIYGLVGLNRDRYYSEWRGGCAFVGVIVSVVALIGTCINVFDFVTAEQKARADIANYSLVELKK